MTPLAEQLATEIAAQGPLRFDRYMARALFDPQHGYYSTGRAKIGREGDFYTSVSVGRIFGRVLAAQCAEIWNRLDRPDFFTLVEQGANDGRLAADILDALRDEHPACYTAVRAVIVEPFNVLSSAQRETLHDHADKAHWTDSLDSLPPFVGVHLTNEYVDALPVRIFVRSEDQWHERHVALEKGQLAFLDLSASDIPYFLPTSVPVGYLAEVRPEAASWISALEAKLTRGAILTIDYGFPREQLYATWRTSGTLSCYHAHRRDDDPLGTPGEKDLTAHVDFTSLAEAGLAAGLELAGFADQYHFLVSAGTAVLHSLESTAPSRQRNADLRALKSLLHPELMGTQFKYLALSRGIAATPPLSGFRHSPPARETLNTTRLGTYTGTEPRPNTPDR